MSDAVKPRRKYDASSRQARAAARRDAIVTVARSHLLTRGYADTSIPEIAEEAGVSAETVYKAIGAKPALVKAVWERSLAGQRPTPAPLRSDAMSDVAADVETIVRGWGELIGEVSPLVSPVVLLVREAAAHDTAMRDLLTEIETERRERMRHNAGKLAGRSKLRPGVSVKTATDVLWTYTSPEIYELLILKSGWSISHFTAFITNALMAALTREPTDLE